MTLKQYYLLPLVDKVLVFLVFLFPVVAAVKHGGTTIYILLILISLFVSKTRFASLSENEKSVLLGFVIFIAILFVGFINTDDYTVAIHHLERYLRVILVIPVYLMLRKRNFDLIYPVLIGCVLASIVMSGQAFYEVEVLKKLEPTSGYNRIIFGDMAVIITGVCIAGLLTLRENKTLQLLLLFGVFFSIYASLQSYSRASWLAVALMIVILAVLYRKQIVKKHLKKLAIAFLAILIVGLFWQPHNLSKGIQAGIDDLKEYNVNPITPVTNSWGSRVNLWYSAWLLFLEKPIIGVGVGDYKNERQRLIEEGKVVNTYGFGHAHNHYLNLLAENGVVGLIALIVFIYFLPAKFFYQYWKSGTSTANERFWALTGLMVLTCFSMFGVAEVWLGRNPFVNIYCMFILVSLVGIHAKKTSL